MPVSPIGRELVPSYRSVRVGVESWVVLIPTKSIEEYSPQDGEGLCMTWEVGKPDDLWTRVTRSYHLRIR